MEPKLPLPEYQPVKDQTLSNPVPKNSIGTIHKKAKIALFFGAFYLCLGILIGAFAAHGLKDMLTEYQLGILQTGVKYQLVHGVALLALGLLFGQYQKRLFYIASICVILGLFLFSFSLYAIALFSVSSLGVITPIGGILMIAGWLMTMFAIVKD